MINIKIQKGKIDVTQKINKKKNIWMALRRKSCYGTWEDV